MALSLSGLTIRERIEQILMERPGLTASQMASILFDDGRATSRLQFPLSVLLSRGRVRRDGGGGIGDPHRYWRQTRATGTRADQTEDAVRSARTAATETTEAWSSSAKTCTVI